MHGGELIYTCKDKYGPIEVVEFKNTIRGLHFGNKTQQTGMFLYNPIILIHKYTQAMLTPICWMQPEKTLILGMGGGSLTKYLMHYFPEMHIDAIELRKKVIEIAQQYFFLPEINNQFHIHCSSVEEYLSENKNDQYDLILVDLFLTKKNQDITVSITEKLKELRSIISKKGCICINLIGNTYYDYSNLESLRNEFKLNIYAIHIEDNNVVIIITERTIQKNNKQIDFTVIDKKYGLAFSQFYNLIKAV